MIYIVYTSIPCFYDLQEPSKANTRGVDGKVTLKTKQVSIIKVDNHYNTSDWWHVMNVNVSSQLEDAVRYYTSKCGISVDRLVELMTRHVGIIAGLLSKISGAQPNIVLDHDSVMENLYKARKSLVDDEIIMYPLGILGCPGLPSNEKCSLLYIIAHEMCHNIVASECFKDIKEALAEYNRLLRAYGYTLHPEEVLCNTISSMVYDILNDGTSLPEYDLRALLEMNLVLMYSRMGLCWNAVDRLGRLEDVMDGIELESRTIPSRVVDRLSRLYRNACTMYNDLLSKYKV